MAKITTKYSPPENHYLTLDIEFATAYGINQALIFDKLYRLQTVLSGYTDESGNKWVRLTYEEWEEELPFMARNTIIRTIENLEKDRLIISTVFERRSKWYRCNPEYISIHKVSTQNGYIDDEYLPKMGTSSTQNGYLPKLPPISSPSYKSKKNKKQKQELKPPVFEDYNPLAQSLLLLCKLDPVLVNGTKLDFLGVMKFFTAKEIQPARVVEFGQWYGQTPTLKAITDNWGRFEAGELPPHKQYKQNGANHNGHKPEQKTTGIKLTPAEQQRADEISRRIEAAATASRT